MKKVFVLFVMVMASFCAHAQFTSNNSFLRKSIVTYEQDDNGYYRRVENKMVEQINDIVLSYAYDKKSQNLYVLTQNSNTVITLTKDYAKVIKKDKTIPQLTDEELNIAIHKYTKQLDDKFTAINEERTKHIQDSIVKAELHCR